MLRDSFYYVNSNHTRGIYFVLLSSDGWGERKWNYFTEVWVGADGEKLPRSGAATAGLKGSSFQRLSVQSCYFFSFLFFVRLGDGMELRENIFKYYSRARSQK